MSYEKRNWLSGMTPISKSNLEAMDDALFQNSKVAETIPALKETVNKNSKAIILLEGILNEEGLSGLLSEYFKKHPLEEALDVYPILEGNEPPTQKTKGEKRQLYYYIDGNTLYICRGYGNGGYMWELASSQLTEEQISTALSEYLKNNPVSPVGKDGITPHIGDNGNWYIGDEDTGVKAVGKDGYSPTIDVSKTDTGYDITISHTGNTVEKISINHGVDGENGADGQDGKTPVLGVDYFTESDKANIVSSVIDSLGGNPVFGVVDENNNIVVSGNLPDGTYTVKYELEDGTTVSIGDLVLTEDNPDSGEEIPTYTNLAQPNTDNTTDFTIWCNNARMSGDGSVTARDGYTVTNYVALSNGDTFRVKGFKIERVGLFSANKTALSSGVGNLANLQTNQYVEGGYSQTDEETTFTAKNSNIAYARLSGWVNNTVDDVIITKNEEIV